MANNRMMLKCKVCGAEKVIAKRGLGEYVEYRPIVEKSLNEFYETHWWCGFETNLKNVDTHNTFELVYEFDEE